MKTYSTAGKHSPGARWYTRLETTGDYSLVVVRDHWMSRAEQKAINRYLSRIDLYNEIVSVSKTK